MPWLPVLVVLGIGAFLYFGTKVTGGKVIIQQSTSPSPLGGSQPQHYQDMMAPGSTATNNNLRVGDLLIVSMGIMPGQVATSTETHGSSLVPVGASAGASVTWHAVAAGPTTLVAHFANAPDGKMNVNVRA